MRKSTCRESRTGKEGDYKYTSESCERGMLKKVTATHRTLHIHPQRMNSALIKIFGKKWLDDDV